jgi:flagellar biosynthesis/type III secretory pathway M-ring protein FliF/YscJ
MKEPKSKILNVRLTESQSQKIMDYLEESKIKYKTKSEFIRNMILNKIGRKVEIPYEG